jgi:ring-1,2-phenylacetyl-CoA epoxidase subunit PaaC
MARLLVFSSWRLALLDHLGSAPDPVLAAVAAKGVKELRYHREHAARWCITLAHGTGESRERMVAGLDAVWPFVAELEGTEPASAFAEAMRAVDTVLELAGLERPDVAPAGGRGREGRHTEPFVTLLEEMQGLARAHPRGRW